MCIVLNNSDVKLYMENTAKGKKNNLKLTTPI